METNARVRRKDTNAGGGAAARVTAAILIIGDEILCGRTQETNLAFLARLLGERGIQVAESRIVADHHETIIEAVRALRERYTYVITTGGIGPTHDDITARALACAFGVALRRNTRAVALLQGRYGKDLNAARLKMADIPQGAELVDNPVSCAPGFRIGNVIALAGVPAIMRVMAEGIASTLTGGVKLSWRSVACAIGEGELAEGLERIQKQTPTVAIGSYPWFKRNALGVNVVLRGTGREEVERAAGAVRELAESLGDSPIVT